MKRHVWIICWTQQGTCIQGEADHIVQFEKVISAQIYRPVVRNIYEQLSRLSSTNMQNFMDDVYLGWRSYELRHRHNIFAIFLSALPRQNASDKLTYSSRRYPLIYWDKIYRDKCGQNVNI